MSKLGIYEERKGNLVLIPVRPATDEEKKTKLIHPEGILDVEKFFIAPKEKAEGNERVFKLDDISKRRVTNYIYNDKVLLRRLLDLDKE